MLPTSDSKNNRQGSSKELLGSGSRSSSRKEGLVTELWAHQKKALQLARERKSLALFWEMGTGKTRAMIEILEAVRRSRSTGFKTLIFCPIIVMQNWKREFLLYSGLEERDIGIVYGSQKQRCDALEKGHSVWITNYESLLMATFVTRLHEVCPAVLVFDESHKLKNLRSKRTMAAIKLADRSKRRYLLSGTPVLNSPMDLFSQYRVLDLGETFGTNFYSFRAEYFVDKNAGMPKIKYFPNWVVRRGALEAMNSKIAGSSMTVKKKDCLDLPPLVKTKVYVEMSPEQKAIYESMQKDFVAFTLSGMCVASLAITKGLRLMQIVSGYLPVEEGQHVTETAFKETPREAALRELLSELTPQHKVIVWAVYHSNYATIRKACDDLSLSYVEIHGQVSTDLKFKAVDRFNNDPSVRVLIGHPGSGGIGINLVAASYSIFYSRNFSLENDLQAEARNYRGGSEIHEKITRIDFVTPGTIDELVLKSLENKIDVGEKILRSIAEELK